MTLHILFIDGTEALHWSAWGHAHDGVLDVIVNEHVAASYRVDDIVKWGEG